MSKLLKCGVYRELCNKEYVKGGYIGSYIRGEYAPKLLQGGYNIGSHLIGEYYRAY